jgi:hypothetical protein
MSKMNPLHWKREHQIAFFGAAVAGAFVGFFAGIRQVGSSANIYWLLVGIWGVVGAVVAAAGAFIRQLFSAIGIQIRNITHFLGGQYRLLIAARICSNELRFSVSSPLK